MFQSIVTIFVTSSLECLGQVKLHDNKTVVQHFGIKFTIVASLSLWIMPT